VLCQHDGRAFGSTPELNEICIMRNGGLALYQQGEFFSIHPLDSAVIVRVTTDGVQIVPADEITRYTDNPNAIADYAPDQRILADAPIPARAAQLAP
jgi:hypothetical protein